MSTHSTHEPRQALLSRVGAPGGISGEIRDSALLLGMLLIVLGVAAGLASSLLLLG